MTDIDTAPICHDLPMIAVISRATSEQAYDCSQDTPVWWCAECHRKIKREEESRP